MQSALSTLRFIYLYKHLDILESAERDLHTSNWFLENLYESKVPTAFLPQYKCWNNLILIFSSQKVTFVTAAAEIV